MGASKHTGTKEASKSSTRQVSLPKSATRRSAAAPYKVPSVSKRVGK